MCCDTEKKREGIVQLRKGHGRRGVEVGCLRHWRAFPVKESWATPWTQPQGVDEAACRRVQVKIPTSRVVRAIVWFWTGCRLWTMAKRERRAQWKTSCLRAPALLLVLLLIPSARNIRMDHPPPYTEIPDDSITVPEEVQPVAHGLLRVTSGQNDGTAENLYSLLQSSNEYFDSRPLTNAQPGETTTCYISFDPKARRQDIHFPLPEQALLERDVTVQDWFTFINHLYPQNAEGQTGRRSARDEVAMPEKKTRQDSSISRKPLPASARSISQSSRGQLHNSRERDQTIDAVIMHWNEGFFIPRGLQILRERSRSASNAGSVGGSKGDQITDPVAWAMEILKNQGYVRPSSSLSNNAPEAACSTGAEAIFPTRRASEDSPLPSGGTEVHHDAGISNRIQQHVHAELGIGASACSTSKGKASKLSMRPKEDTNFPSGTHPQAIALYKAVSKGDKSMTKVLLQSGVNPNVSDMSGASTLYRSVARGDSSIVKLLIEHPIDPNIITTTGDFPLYRAVSRGDSSVVRYLLMLSIDVNAKNAKGKTPLVKAVQKGDSSIVKMLLDRDADISIECNGLTALSLAAERGQHKIANLILKSQQRVTQPPWAH